MFVLKMVAVLHPRLPLYDQPCFCTVLSKDFRNSSSVVPSAMALSTAPRRSERSSPFIAPATTKALECMPSQRSVHRSVGRLTFCLKNFMASSKGRLVNLESISLQIPKMLFRFKPSIQEFY